MKTYHWNGENWYKREWSILHHIRHWFIWIGGWEKANGAGWKLFNRFYRGKLKLNSPTPVSLFGHWITFFGWGVQIRGRQRYLVFSKFGTDYLKIYLSPNGTPSRATTWLKGAPFDVRIAADLDDVKASMGE